MKVCKFYTCVNPEQSPSELFGEDVAFLLKINPPRSPLAVFSQVADGPIFDPVPLLYRGRRGGIPFSCFLWAKCESQVRSIS